MNKMFLARKEASDKGWIPKVKRQQYKRKASPPSSPTMQRTNTDHKKQKWKDDEQDDFFGTVEMTILDFEPASISEVKKEYPDDLMQQVVILMMDFIRKILKLLNLTQATMMFYRHTMHSKQHHSIEQILILTLTYNPPFKFGFYISNILSSLLTGMITFFRQILKYNGTRFVKLYCTPSSLPHAFLMGKTSFFSSALLQL